MFHLLTVVLSSRKECRISMTRVYSITYVHCVVFVVFLPSLYDAPCFCCYQILSQGWLELQLMFSDMEYLHDFESKHAPDCSTSHKWNYVPSAHPKQSQICLQDVLTLNSAASSVKMISYSWIRTNTEIFSKIFSFNNMVCFVGISEDFFFFVWLELNNSFKFQLSSHSLQANFWQLKKELAEHCILLKI